MEKELTIRHIGMDDFPEIGRMASCLHGLHAAGRPDIFAVSREVMKREALEEIISSDAYISLIAETGDRAVGYGVAKIKEPSGDPLLAAHRTMHIDEIYVEPDCRRNGIGKALMEHFEAEGKRRGAERMDLTAWAFNHAAVEFYKNLGMGEQRIILEKRL